MATAHLVFGPTAAGKSNLALQLASERNAVRFAVDEWMHELFAPDALTPLEMAWVLPRVARCQSRIWATCVQILASGRDVVLELGLLRRADRQRVQALVEAARHQPVFRFVDAERAVRWQRVLQRNQDKGPTHSFDITAPMFEAMEQFFERPDAAEARVLGLPTSAPTHG